MTQDSPILSRLGITSPPIATGHCQYPGGDTGAERDLRGNPALVYRCSNVYGMDMDMDHLFPTPQQLRMIANMLSLIKFLDRSLSCLQKNRWMFATKLATIELTPELNDET